MKLISAVGLCIAFAVTAGAQSQQTTTKTKVEVKDGKDVSLIGCVQPATSGSGFVLIDNTDKNGAVRNYLMVTDEVDLSKHVGHRVEIKGKAADRGDGKVETATSTKTKIEHGDDHESKTKTEVRGNLDGLPIIGVKSLKMMSTSCS